MFSRRLLAAAIEPLMLSLLAGGPMYGYEIIKKARSISGDQIRWSNSKLYPLLHQMEYNDLVESFWRESGDGPDRKYYRLKPKGRHALKKTKQEWLSMNQIFTALWSPDPSFG